MAKIPVQEITQSVCPGAGEPVTTTILRRQRLDKLEPTMTQSEFLKYAQTLTVGMIKDHVELMTDVEEGWVYILLDPLSMRYVQIRLRVFEDFTLTVGGR